MDSALIHPPNTPNRQKPSDFIGENHELALNQSIQDLLHSQNHDFSALSSTFYELMQARPNPALESIWVYSASIFRQSNSLKDEISDRVSAIKALFQLMSGCSASCGSSKSIVFLAPVMYEVYRVIADLKGKELGSKREKKLMREIRSFVNAILGYISVCCSANDDGDDFIRPLEDLIRVWIGDVVDETLEAKEVFTLFFPLLGDDIVGRLGVEGCGVSEFAGVVIAEAFLLKLCLDFCSGDSKQELRSWAVGSITGFRHFYFFETLVRMLLEDTLPVTSLLSSEDEVSVRKVLYDAVILVDYSFLNLDKLTHLPAKRVKSLAISRLLVTYEATELFRGKGDQTKAISYINAFSGSQLPSQLIKLVANEIGVDSKAGQPRGSSPKALLKWLLGLEDQGIRLLDDDITKYKSKLAIDISEAEHEQLVYTKEGTKANADLGFYIDNKGEEEDVYGDDGRTNESVNAAFVAAAHTMASAENGGGRKRKERTGVGKKKHVKFLKYNLQDNSGSSGEKSTVRTNDGSNSGSEVENPLSDEDIDEVKEK
ncbi:hypothetical protein CEY00_Acc09860 [Actinidia chinensis var. chinensis]|uniref:Uncharacterized protein n=1 Tax=Actinidia chinensis var. chinensis TaxID=1590841 RepID=A0A2R6R488_ACTCC|nr:hypothetical protein CEY00_Acc09860 [Actinidia chinensis var. chinensis]